MTSDRIIASRVLRQRIKQLRQEAKEHEDLARAKNAEADQLARMPNSWDHYFAVACAVICTRSGVKQSQLLSKARTNHVAFARQMLCYVLLKNTPMSTPIIGQYLERDHSTVCYASKLITGRVNANSEFAATLHYLSEEIDNEVRRQENEVSQTTEVAA